MEPAIRYVFQKTILRLCKDHGELAVSNEANFSTVKCDTKNSENFANLINSILYG